MDTESSTLTEPGDGRWRALTRFGLTQWPYLLMYALAVIGVAWTSRHPEASAVYWEILAPVFALICVAARWPDPADWRSRRRLLWEQALHWGVFVLTMQLLFLPDVQRMIDSDVIGLFVLYLLGMATFLPGVYYSIWQLVPGRRRSGAVGSGHRLGRAVRPADPAGRFRHRQRRRDRPVVPAAGPAGGNEPPRTPLTTLDDAGAANVVKSRQMSSFFRDYPFDFAGKSIFRAENVVKSRHFVVIFVRNALIFHDTGCRQKSSYFP